ncbi:MAG: dynamin family protein [Oscillospiraceae bacterium]|nr:dynamin family protein [Oscillospiraceae bacterium]
MQKVELHYDPYKLKTLLSIDGVNIVGHADYLELSNLIEMKMPLQSWIDPIEYKGWNGILEALKSDKSTDEIAFDFYGRDIDYNDFVRACENQNAKREYKLILNFNHYPTRSDVETARDIEDVKKVILSKEFAEIMSDFSKDSAEYKAYQTVEEKYNRAKKKEFRVVFAGLYSSGKSLIINTLIRRGILPVSNATCTDKTCRIVHEPSYTDTVSIRCLDKNGKAVKALPRQEFDTDEKCLEYFKTITQKPDSDKKVPDYDSIEIHVNLSHLYPSKEMEEMFTLTIVDTPGTNSSKTVGMIDGVNNLHKEITLAAINNPDKDMVVLCVDAQNYQDTSLGELMVSILSTSEDENGSFADRFMFVANKCDCISYKDDEKLDNFKTGFAEYLMNKKQWGLNDNNNSFVPKIFMTTAGVENAIQCGAYKYTPVELKGSKEKRDQSDMYDKFVKEVVRYENSDLMLLQHCDIPSYRSQEMTEKYNSFVNDNSIPEAVSLQTGIPCIESTIKDYIERYAYPFKVRSLMEAFDILLEAVDADIERRNKALEEIKMQLGNVQSQGEEAQKEKDETERRKKQLAKINERISKAKREIERIKIEGKLTQIAENFEFAIEDDAEIQWMRVQINSMQSKEVIDRLVNNIFLKVESAKGEADKKYMSFEKKYKYTILDILEKLKSVCQDFEDNDYSFQKTITGKEISNLDLSGLIADAAEAVKDSRKEVIVQKTNPVKQIKYKKYQIFKRLGQLFADDYISVTQGVYSMEPLRNSLNKMIASFRVFCEETETVYKTDLMSIQKSALEKISLYAAEIAELNQRIDDYNKSLMVIKQDKEKLQSEMNKLNKYSKKLSIAREKLLKGGNVNV